MRTAAPLLLIGVASAADVMNAGGIPYSISNPDPANPTAYKANFEDLSMEYFDVYGKVETRYSQVYWTRNDPVALPADIIKRFKGKVMAITGYEVDQVMTDDPSSKTNSRDAEQTDKPVPIYNAYNHHYFGWLNGEDSEMYKLDKEEHFAGAGPTWWGVRDLPSAAGNGGYPTNIVFKENPGGEYRKVRGGEGAARARRNKPVALTRRKKPVALTHPLTRPLTRHSRRRPTAPTAPPP